MGLLEDCKLYFNTDNLYKVLGCSETASTIELQKSFRKTSLAVHPDRADLDDKEISTRKFQVLSKVHYLLSDDNKRALYDESGEIDEENDIPEDKDWSDYWRLLFPRLDMQKIDKFMAEYLGSEEELENLKTCYLEHEGCMNKISESLLGYVFDEEERYRDLLTDLIKDKEIPDFPAFSKESAAKKKSRKKRFEKEKKEANIMLKERAAEQDSLKNAILKRAEVRQTNFDDMISNLEKKYCKKPKKK